VSASAALKPRSRRALLAGAAGAGAALLAGCGGKPLREKIRSGARVTAADVKVLNRLLDVENYGIAAYAVGIPLMTPAAAAMGKQFLAQEQSHAVELGDLIRGAGEKPAKPPATYELGDPRTQADAFALIERAERRQLEAYLQMIPSLSGGQVRAALATIFANDAQHLAVLRQQSGQPLPGAFTVT
jgi:Ferritin-like domain